MTLVRTALFSFAVLVGLPLSAPPAQAATVDGGKTASHSNDLCAGALRQVESRKGLPRGLMAAIATVESGRWNDARQARIAWPWTVQAEGKGRYFPDKAAAIRAVKALQDRGVTNIDVGCMQVNLHYHGHHFADLAAAMDPATNAAYAAEFLEALYREKGSWSRAVALYHSRTRALNRPYKAKVFAAWREQVRADRPVARPAAAGTRSRLNRRAKPKLWRLANARKAQAARTSSLPAKRTANPLLKLKRAPKPETARPAKLRRLQAPRSPLRVRGANPPRRYRHSANPLLSGRRALGHTRLRSGGGKGHGKERSSATVAKPPTPSTPPVRHRPPGL
ncbi:MAG: transglycosylase SLT domain-containing protein [Alphaproteobacteria bacterium]|nr:transglycosylase SLT domain-containing protein [Alphaproteobacteria bacterium]